MIASTNIESRSKLSLWMQAVRPFAYSASVIPVLVGTALAYAYFIGSIDWYLFPIVLIASVLLHTGTNLVSEYWDYKKGVDRFDTFGSSRILVENLMQPKEVLVGGYVAFALGFFLGLILVYVRGWEMLILGIVGILGGIFYTSAPVNYKYVGLGDILVFLLMGPLMVIGSYYALTGDYNTQALLVSLPVGFLVTAILHANNLRDIKHDTEAKIKTLANIIGPKASQVEYFSLVLLAYITVIALVIFNYLSVWTLVVLLSLPPAIANLKTVLKADVNNPNEIAMLDVKTAQHHMLFGLLLTVGIIIPGLL